MSELFKNLENKSILITGHINPDGDALGAALSFKIILALVFICILNSFSLISFTHIFMLIFMIIFIYLLPFLYSS